MALYGNISIRRAYCQSCEGWYFVLDGKMACCGVPCDGEFVGFHRMSEPPNLRKRPASKDQKSILLAQMFRCFYCDRTFGHMVYRNGKIVRLRITWDHQVPFSFKQDNSNRNFVASCQVCNNLKTEKIFQTDEEARTYLYDAWQRKGYGDIMPKLRDALRPETLVAKILPTPMLKDGLV